MSVRFLFTIITFIIRFKIPSSLPFSSETPLNAGDSTREGFFSSLPHLYLISPVNTPVTPQAALSGIGYLWQGCKLYLPVDYVSSDAEVGH